MAKKIPLYTLRLELLDVSPVIWRRVRVPADIDLATLHYVFQIVMGWTDSHMHSFSINGTDYQIDIDEDDDFSHEANIPLNSVLNDAREFFYAYDFGDNWRHRVVVESTQRMEEVWSFPVCLAGERACPPEDVGGIPGYESFLEIISNPKDEEYESTLLWAGGAFSPESFDINRVNRELNGFCLAFDESESDSSAGGGGL